MTGLRATAPVKGVLSHATFCRQRREHLECRHRGVGGCRLQPLWRVLAKCGKIIGYTNYPTGLRVTFHDDDWYRNHQRDRPLSLATVGTATTTTAHYSTASGIPSRRSGRWAPAAVASFDRLRLRAPWNQNAC